jgi:hypothetical protein
MNSIVAEKKWIVDNLRNQLPETARMSPGQFYESLSQSYLRSETELSTQSVIGFLLQKNQVQTPIVTERLLNLNDVFVVTHFSVGIKQVASSTDGNHLNAVIHNYENPQVFSGANSVNVASIFNGSFNWTINRRQYIPEFPMRAFRRVPEAQSSLQALSAGTATTPADTFSPAGLDGYPNGLFGFYPCEPTALNGRQTQDIEIDLGASIAMDDDNLINYAVLELRGYLVTNVKD